MERESSRIDLQRDSIGLKPINKGLGLDHFSESGLPYTPSKFRKRAAVPFNFPKTETKQTPVVEKRVEKHVEFHSDETPAGFFRRIFAYFIDIAVSVGIFSFIVWGSFAFNGYTVASILSEGWQTILPLILLYVVVYLGYFLVQETTWKKTIGKAIFGLEIKSDSGFATIGRSLCFLIAAIPFGAGLVWGMFDSKNRCWHDVMTNSQVVLR